MQARERDLHELLVVETASPNTALTLSLTPSSFRTRPNIAIDIIRSLSSLTRYRTTSSLPSLAAEPALACKVRSPGSSSQHLQLGAHITLKHDIVTSDPSLHWHIITCIVTSSLLRTGEPRGRRDVVYLSLLPFHPQPFLLPSTTSRLLLYLHQPLPYHPTPIRPCLTTPLSFTPPATTTTAPQHPIVRQLDKSSTLHGRR